MSGRFVVLRFNTSHVTLYRKPVWELDPVRTFQYITCYSLSNLTPDTVDQIWAFQYITCYSLSESSSFLILLICACFNTSHVTLYRRAVLSSSINEPVSIHHMLLFIWAGGKRLQRYEKVSIHHMLLFIRISCSLFIVSWKFQYITCYSLSFEHGWMRK